MNGLDLPINSPAMPVGRGAGPAYISPMDPAMLKMILMATVVIVVTTAIAKVLKIGTDLTTRSKPRHESGGHCCLSGLADISHDLCAARDDDKAR